jgi:hypothetical protein
LSSRRVIWSAHIAIWSHNHHICYCPHTHPRFISHALTLFIPFSSSCLVALQPLSLPSKPTMRRRPAHHPKPRQTPCLANNKPPSRSSPLCLKTLDQISLLDSSAEDSILVYHFHMPILSLFVSYPFILQYSTPPVRHRP